MKILEVTDERILFDDGQTITYDFVQDCCEVNYASFDYIQEEVGNYDFDKELIFEKVSDFGFRFGDKRRMYSVPCYSCQNGYYSSNVNILYNGSEVLRVDAKILDF